MNLKIVLAFSFLVASISGSILAQSWKFELEKGALNRCAEPLRLVLPLTLDEDSRLKLDRKIWEKHALSDDEREQKEIDKWIARGVDAKRAKEFAGRMNAGGNQTGLHDLLDDVATSARASGFSRSGSFRSIRGDDLLLSLGEDGDSVQFEAVERKSPYRTLRVNDDARGEFRILLTADDYLLQINQKPNMPIRVVMIAPDDTFQARSDSFAQFAEQHPQRCDFLLDVLGHAGFDAPPMMNSPSVVAEVKKQLALLLSDSGGGEELFAALESDEFAVREEAEKTFLEQFDMYEVAIRKKQGEAGTSPQLQSMLAKIIKEATSGDGDTRVVDFVAAQNLVNSPNYLGFLLKDATDEERKLIFQQLDRVTGKQFNEDLEKLHLYLEANQDR